MLRTWPSSRLSPKHTSVGWALTLRQSTPSASQVTSPLDCPFQVCLQENTSAIARLSLDNPPSHLPASWAVPRGYHLRTHTHTGSNRSLPTGEWQWGDGTRLRLDSSSRPLFGHKKPQFCPPAIWYQGLGDPGRPHTRGVKGTPSAHVCFELSLQQNLPCIRLRIAQATDAATCACVHALQREPQPVQGLADSCKMSRPGWARLAALTALLLAAHAAAQEHFGQPVRISDQVLFRARLATCQAGESGHHFEGWCTGSASEAKPCQPSRVSASRCVFTCP